MTHFWRNTSTIVHMRKMVNRYIMDEVVKVKIANTTCDCTGYPGLLLSFRFFFLPATCLLFIFLLFSNYISFLFYYTQ